MKSLFRSILFSLLASASLLTAATPASAQDFNDIGLTIRPAIVEVVVSPGETIVQEITLENISAEAVGVVVKAESLLADQIIIDPSKQNENEAREWIQADSSQITLQRNEQRIIQVAIEAPLDANPGGHYASVSFESFSFSNTGNSNNTTTTVRPKLAAAFLITVPGPTAEIASVDILELNKIQFGSEGKALVEVRNTGNIHILPTLATKLFVGSDDNSEVRIPPEIILPNTLKRFEIKWDVGGLIKRSTMQVSGTFGSPQQDLISPEYSYWRLPSVIMTVFILSLGSFAIFFTFFANNRWVALQRLISGRRKYNRDPNNKNLKQSTKERSSLDDLASSTALPESKTRKIDTIPAKPKRQTILDDDSINNQKVYQKKLAKSLDVKRKKSRRKK